MPPLTLGTVQYMVRFLGPELMVIFSGYRSSGGFGTVWVCQGEGWREGKREGEGGVKKVDGRGEGRRGEERRGEERRGEERRGEERRGEERRGEERRGEERRDNDMTIR